MQIGTVDLNKLRGLADKTVGLGKELVGTLVGSDRMQRAGEAQQERATEQIRARAEVKAQANDAKAMAFEQQERVAQAAKD